VSLGTGREEERPHARRLSNTDSMDWTLNVLPDPIDINENGPREREREE